MFIAIGQIQLGMSNSDYGAMMDLEYKCFNEVGSENNHKKSGSYWYRISDRGESSEYFPIEVGCWQEGKFTATVIVTGLKIKDNSLFDFNSQLITQTIKKCPREFTGRHFNCAIFHVTQVTCQMWVLNISLNIAHCLSGVFITKFNL